MLISSSVTDVHYENYSSALTSRRYGYTAQPDIIKYRVVQTHTCTGISPIRTKKRTVSVRVSNLEIRMHASKRLCSCKDLHCFIYIRNLDTEYQTYQDGASPHCGFASFDVRYPKFIVVQPHRILDTADQESERSQNGIRICV